MILLLLHAHPASRSSIHNRMTRKITHPLYAITPPRDDIFFFSELIFSTTGRTQDSQQDAESDASMRRSRGDPPKAAMFVVCAPPASGENRLGKSIMAGCAVLSSTQQSSFVYVVVVHTYPYTWYDGVITHTPAGFPRSIFPQSG